MTLKALFVPECLRLFRYCFLCTCSKKIHETDEIVKMKSLKFKAKYKYLMSYFFMYK